MKHHAKQAIMDSFKQLASRKSMDKITVKEVCELCNVNRQTFYNHFTDIMDVFKVMFYGELSVDIIQNRSMDTWEGGFLATMNYMKRNSKMIMHINHSSYWCEAVAYFASLSNRLLEGVVEECAQQLKVKLQEKDQQFIINFYRHVFNGLIIDWISEGMEEEPEQVLNKLLIMISGSIPRAVTAFVEQQK